MMQQQLPTNQASGKKLGYLETTTGKELLLRQAKIQQHKNLSPTKKL
jgi:hypothetical protein